MDNLLEVELVLASGETVIANKMQHADLFRALKGGGNNFGILTRVDVKVAKGVSEKIWGGQIVVPATRGNMAVTIKSLVEFTAANNEDPNMALQLGIRYDSWGMQVIDIAPATTDGRRDLAIFKPLTSLWPRLYNTMRMDNIRSLVDEYNELQPSGYRQTAATITIANDLESVVEVQKIIDEVYASVKRKVGGLVWTYNYTPQPAVIQNFTAEAGGNVLGMSENPRDQIGRFPCCVI